MTFDFKDYNFDEIDDKLGLTSGTTRSQYEKEKQRNNDLKETGEWLDMNERWEIRKLAVSAKMGKSFKASFFIRMDKQKQRPMGTSAREFEKQLKDVRLPRSGP